MYTNQLSTQIMESLYHMCQMVYSGLTQFKIHVKFYKGLRIPENS